MAADAEENCGGLLYRAKREGVPVYAEPDTTSRVVHRLTLGERVCYVGEQKAFAILDWREYVPAEQTEPRVAFARLVDLWAPNERRGGVVGFFNRVKGFLYYIINGGVPEDPLLPYRPLIRDRAAPLAGNGLDDADAEQ